MSVLHEKVPPDEYGACRAFLQKVGLENDARSLLLAAVILDEFVKDAEKDWDHLGSDLRQQAQKCREVGEFLAATYLITNNSPNVDGQTQT